VLVAYENRTEEDSARLIEAVREYKLWQGKLPQQISPRQADPKPVLLCAMP
jgi:hypothetical protein